MKFRSTAILAAACAATAAGQEAPRIAVFVPGYIIEYSAQGKRVFAEAQALGKRLQDSISAKMEELQKMEQQLRSPSISEEGRGRITREYEDGKTALQRMNEDGRAQFQKVEQAAVQQFQGEIGPVIEAVAKEQGIQCVLQPQEGMIAWADPAWIMKFTEEVAKRYDAAYPGGSAAKK